MGDLVPCPKQEVICDSGEESAFNGGAIQPYPSTVYQGLTIKDSSEVHVGSKYVADKIVIVLPKSESVDLPKFDRNLSTSSSSKSDYSARKKGENLKCFVLVIILVVASALASFVLGFIVFDDRSDPPFTSAVSQNTPSASWTHTTSSTVTSTDFSTTLTATVPEISEGPTTEESLTTLHVDTPTTTEFVTTEKITTTEVTLSPTLAALCDTPGNDKYLPLISNTVILDVSQVAGDPCIVRPDQWGSQPCDACVPYDRLGPVYEVTIHFIDKCGSFDSCGYLMRLYDSNFAHRYTIAENDFLYNFVIGGDCRVYEGLGWDRLLSGTATLHVGIQLWDQQDGNRLSTRQVYIMMLLLNVGRWCGKIGLNFSTPYVCPITDCLRFFPIQRYFRYASSDKYLISDGEPFFRDSKMLGVMFDACKGCELKNVYKFCQEITC